MYINLIALLYVLLSRSAQIRALDPLLILFSSLTSQKYRISLKSFEKVFHGRFGALTGGAHDLMKNLETPGKTGRVGK